MRLAVVCSLRDVKWLVRECRRRSKPLEPLLALYDALVDDDDEVRDIAAQVHTFAVSPADNGSPDVKSHGIPGPAADDLIHFFASRKPQDIREARSVVTLCVSRILGLGSLGTETLWTTRGSTASARELLETALAQDNALFIEEKPNLYVDPVSEAKRWARVLGGNGLESYLPMSVLGPWILKGLDALLEQSQARVAGPLGWSSDPEVFVVGMRILIMALFVAQNIQRLKRGTNLCPVDLGPQCLDKLRRLQTLGDEKGGLHQIWRTHIAWATKLLTEHEGGQNHLTGGCSKQASPPAI